MVANWRYPGVGEHEDVSRVSMNELTVAVSDPG